MIWVTRARVIPWNDSHDLVGRYPTRQDADAAVIGDPDWAKGDRNLLFAVGLRGSANLAGHGGVDDSEPDFGASGGRAVS
jgi:hypothetical protein